MCIDPAKRYTAEVVTSLGTLVIALDAAGAPKTVNNFVFLARYHYYDGIIFHRIIKGFMCQGGDPTGTGRGGPGYRFADELPKPGPLRGRLGGDGQRRAQHQRQPVLRRERRRPACGLPPQYSLFGKVVKGLDVVDADGVGDHRPQRPAAGRRRDPVGHDHRGRLSRLGGGQRTTSRPEAGTRGTEGIVADVDFSAYLAPFRGGRAASLVLAGGGGAAGPRGGPHLRRRQRDAADAPAPGPRRQRDRWQRLELVTAYLFNRLPPFEHPGEPFHFVTLQATPAFRRLWTSGAVQVLPSRYSDMARLCGPDGPLPCDVAIVQVSPPGPEGKVSLGVVVGANVHPARTAPLVIAQVNPQVPYTFGAGELPVEEIDLLVEVDEPIIIARPAGAADPVGHDIARLAAAFVEDGSTIQFGVGALPDAILAQLPARRGLRVHSGLVSEACADLYEAGCIEGADGDGPGDEHAPHAELGPPQPRGADGAGLLQPRRPGARRPRALRGAELHGRGRRSTAPATPRPPAASLLSGPGGRRTSPSAPRWRPAGDR